LRYIPGLLSCLLSSMGRRSCRRCFCLFPLPSPSRCVFCHHRCCRRCFFHFTFYLIVVWPLLLPNSWHRSPTGMRGRLGLLLLQYLCGCKPSCLSNKARGYVGDCHGKFFSILYGRVSQPLVPGYKAQKFCLWTEYHTSGEDIPKV
jgi:hypothetical protein